MWEVHADVLKMAKSEEQREAIKWFHARSTFFAHGDEPDVAGGLALARESEHPDARFLASLFPENASGVAWQWEEASDVFLAQGDEPRSLCWAVSCGAEPREDLLRRSAEGGCAWGAAMYSSCSSKGDKLALLEKAAAQSDPDALYRLCDCEGMEERAAELLRRGAEVGDPDCQYTFAKKCFAEDAVERFEWLRRAAVQDHVRAWVELKRVAMEQITLRDGGGSGRLLYEIGAAFAQMTLTRLYNDAEESAKGFAASFFTRCNEEARKSVQCWLWLAKKEKNVAKDIRLLISDLIWDQRAAWSERPFV